MQIFVNANGQQQGPYSPEEVQDALSRGSLSPDDLCWHEGLSQWQPIASVLASAQRPPDPPTPAPASAKTDPLSIWSLVLGILSWVCFSILAGIPAIICGHLSLRRLKKNALLQGKGMAIAGLVLGYASSLVLPVLLAALAIPALSVALERGEAMPTLSSARQIQLVLQMASIDRTSTGNKNIGLPADVGLSTVGEVKQMLIAGNYLTAGDLEKLGVEQFLIGNVSENDPPNTILLKSKPAPGKRSVVFLKGGDGLILSPGQAARGIDPPRDPPFLE